MGKPTAAKEQGWKSSWIHAYTKPHIHSRAGRRADRDLPGGRGLSRGSLERGATRPLSPIRSRGGGTSPTAKAPKRALRPRRGNGGEDRVGTRLVIGRVHKSIRAGFGRLVALSCSTGWQGRSQRKTEFRASTDPPPEIHQRSLFQPTVEHN